MFTTLFRRNSAVRMQQSGAFAAARSTYLEHLSKQGHTPATIRNYARDLLGVAQRIEMTPDGKASMPAVAAAVDRWIQETNRASRSARARAIKAAESWLHFSGLFVETQKPRPAAEQVDQYTRYLRDERGLSPATVESRLKTVNTFLSWLEDERSSLPELALADVDRYLASKGRQTWKRRTVATNAQTLRTFLRHAEHQGWCKSGIAAGIEPPQIYGMENVPLGPSWEQVRALLATTERGSRRDVRDRAALLLFAVYGFRCSEVRQLRLDDIDWQKEAITVRRAKSYKVQTFPLTREVGDAIIRYVRDIRPKCDHRQVFITLHAPWRPVSAAGFYDGIRERIDEIGIDLAHRGPHALRHACATHLMTQGLSLKEIGDHLGHSSSESTRIYAKVDMAGLKEVAEFGLGGL